MKILIFFLLLFVAVNSHGQETEIPNFKKSVIKISKTPFDIYKGTIPVKLDRSGSSSECIMLPVYIIKSKAVTPAEPIYGMTGGPGNANLSDIPPKEFLTNHDIVLVGYRGVDGHVMPKSRKLKKALKGLNNDLLSNESLDNLGLAVNQYFDELATKGMDINHYTIMDVVEDFEDVRKQLGHQKINLYSGSYGTRVALLYSYRYPDAIKRSLMIAVNPPGHFVWSTETTGKIIQKYDSLYKESGEGGPSLEECIRLSFQKLPKRWSFFKLDANKIKVITFYLLYSKNSAVMAFDAYRRAAINDDYSGLYLMQLAYDHIGLFTPEATNYGDLFSKAYSADFNPETDYRQLFRPDSFEIGAPLSMLYGGMGNIETLMSVDDEYRKPEFCTTEVLMVGGELDISTPAEFATTELMPNMPNSKQVVLKNMAHCVDVMWCEHSAFVHMAVRYFDDGVVDTSKYKQYSVNFKPANSFNAMAKWFYPLVFTMSLFD